MFLLIDQGSCCLSTLEANDSIVEILERKKPVMKWGEISTDLDLTLAVNPQPESGALGVSPIKQETNCISIS